MNTYNIKLKTMIEFTFLITICNIVAILLHMVRLNPIHCLISQKKGKLSLLFKSGKLMLRNLKHWLNRKDVHYQPYWKDWLRNILISMEENTNPTLVEEKELKEFKEFQVSSHYLQSESTHKIVKKCYNFLFLILLLLLFNLIGIGYLLFSSL